MENWKIIKVYKEDFPKCRFVGKRYKNSDRVEGGYGFQWEQWFKNGWFLPLEELITDEFKTAYPEAFSSVGLMKTKDNDNEDYFEYWIGFFLPENCQVPDGYEYIDFDDNYVGISWIKGAQGAVFCHEQECYEEISKKGMKLKRKSDGGFYMFERYNCPRFTTPDENNEIILDVGFFVE